MGDGFGILIIYGLPFLPSLPCAPSTCHVTFFSPGAHLASLVVALALAALRGVKVEIVLPRRSNHPPLDWAAFAQHKQLVESGCDIYLAPPPFDHTKLMTVDGGWTMLGSANWDARSLRLNFEYSVAALDTAFTARMDAVIDRKVAASSHLTLRKIAARGTFAKLRDALARLFLPYL
jgi:cardiolipin synthase